jgi:hypothetical protein
MKLEVVDYIELEDGGAVVTFEMDEETRNGLISEAIERRLIEGLERMPDAPKKDGQLDIEEYIARLEARKRVDTVQPAEESSGLQRVEKDS